MCPSQPTVKVCTAQVLTVQAKGAVAALLLAAAVNAETKAAAMPAGANTEGTGVILTKTGKTTEMETMENQAAVAMAPPAAAEATIKKTRKRKKAR